MTGPDQADEPRNDNCPLPPADGAGASIGGIACNAGMN